MSQYETIKYLKENKIGIVIFNRSEKLNAINSQLLNEFGNVLDEAEFDNEVYIVILTGDEKSFSAGRDLKEKRPPGGLKISNRFFSRLETFRKVTIAAIEGHCLGAGLEIALCCDLRIASKTANIGLPEVRVASFPAGGGTFRLPRLVGLERAKRLIYTGSTINGDEAFDIGLVGQVTEQGHALSEGKKIANSMAQHAPLSLITSKACLNAGINVGIDTESYIQFVFNAYELLQKSADYQEGRKAFREKRKPVWKGE